MLNTVASMFMQQQSHFMQNQTGHQAVHGTHTKNVKHTTVLWRACMFFHNRHVSQHQYIHCRKHSLKSRFLPPESSHPAWSFSFTTQTHTVWLPAHGSLHTTLLTIFSTWMIEQFLCQCSTMRSNKANKNLQSHFHDRYVLYSFPHFLH